MIDRVDHAKGVKGVLVLAQDAQLLGAHDSCPSAASISPVKTFIKVDLPAPFGPVRPYRRPRDKVDRDVVK